METTPPEERVAVVQSLGYSSSIAIVTFTTDDLTFQLYGDHRMTSPISAYIGKMVRLFVHSEDNWSWEPLEEPNEEIETL